LIDLPYTAAGFAVGAIVGMTGVGGGSLMTPMLVVGFGVPAVTAVGTDLLYAGITKAGGAVSHGLSGHVDWRITGLLAAGSVPASLLALAALAALPPAGKQAHALVSSALGVMLVLTALAIAFRPRLLAWATRRGNTGFGDGNRTAATLATGAFLGAAVTFSSVGAGAVGVTALMLLFPALATVRVVGTDIAHAVPITLVAGAGHALLGNVDYAMLGSLIAGSLPGIWLGSRLAARLPELYLSRALAVTLLVVGGRMVLH
jgi:uncharacterized membrane protein YfcA